MEASVEYQTVVADPPWPYKNPGEFTSGETAVARGAGSEARYGSLSMEALKALQPPVAANAHAYIWTTNAFICQAHDLMEAWGFRPITVCTWVKTTTEPMKCPQCALVDEEYRIDVPGSYEDVTPPGGGWVRSSARNGYYFKGATEHCVFGVRGKGHKKWREVIPTAWFWPRQAHSVKPEAFFDMVERVSPGPYLEMFARHNRLGWETFGDQALPHVELVPNTNITVPS